MGEPGASSAPPPVPGTPLPHPRLSPGPGWVWGSRERGPCWFQIKQDPPTCCLLCVAGGDSYHNMGSGHPGPGDSRPDVGVKVSPAHPGLVVSRAWMPHLPADICTCPTWYPQRDPAWSRTQPWPAGKWIVRTPLQLALPEDPVGARLLQWDCRSWSRGGGDMGEEGHSLFDEHGLSTCCIQPI